MQEVFTRYILDREQHPVAVQIPFEQFQQIVEALEASGQFIFMREVADDGDLEAEDHTWMQTDVSMLGDSDTYDWQPGELEEGKPLQYIPGTGWVIQE